MDPVPDGASCRKEVAFYRKVDCVCVEAGQARDSGCRSLLEDGCFQGRVLQLDEEIRWPRAGRAEAPAPARRGESKAQVAGGRFERGQGDTPGGGRRRVLTAPQRRIRVSQLQYRFGVVSDVRARSWGSCGRPWPIASSPGLQLLEHADSGYRREPGALWLLASLCRPPARRLAG